MNDFVYDIPTRVFFGRNALDYLGDELAARGNSVLLVYGGGSIKKNGLYDKVLAQISKAGIVHYDLSGVAPNPRIDLVREGVRICKEKQVELVLGVGGGSVMDTAKMVAAGACVEWDTWDFFGKKLPVTKALPILVIPTMAATGSEMNSTAVISNPTTYEKLGCTSQFLRPTAAFMNPEFTYSCSKYQTACGAADILSHIMETYFNPGDSMYMLDASMEALMKTVVKYAPIALAEPDNYEARANLMWASTWAINGFTRSCQNQVWSCHPLEHELSAYYDITHGLGLAIITPPMLQYCLDEKNAFRYCNFGVNVFGLDQHLESMVLAKASIDALCHFLFTTLGLPDHLSDLNITDVYFQKMAEGACAMRGGIIHGIKDLDEEDVVKIFKMAL